MMRECVFSSRYLKCLTVKCVETIELIDCVIDCRDSSTCHCNVDLKIDYGDNYV